MKSYFGGCGTGDTKLHMIHHFDGHRIREIEVMTLSGNVYWTERTIPGILETGIKWTTAKRRLASLEKQASRRIG